MIAKRRGEFLLSLTALIWGISFVAQRAGMEYIGPFTFNGIRSFIGALSLLPVILFMDHKRKLLSERESNQKSPAMAGSSHKKDFIIGGLSCGILFFLSSSLQQMGMVYTTAGKAGFITALYIVIVPVLGLFFKQKVRPILWFCVILATTGLYLLSIQDDFSIGKGELLILLSAFGLSAHILVIDHFSPKTDNLKLSFFQFVVCGILSIPFMTVLETVSWDAISTAMVPLLYTGILSCGVGYTLQIVAQKTTEPTITSLILSAESVIAVVAGILLINEQITTREAIGCLIMFTGILLAQLPGKKTEILITDKGDKRQWQNS